jgi:tRNA threonylcarbamoyl adenosine modification protein (Sua5/YciO/YrdC/YwlC family)
MTQRFYIHPDNPQMRLITQAVDILNRGGVIVYPTDSSYALGCHLTEKNAVARMRQIRQLDDAHYFTLMCRDLSDIATYAQVDNTTYRFLKAHTPGPYTFLLNATKEMPKKLRHIKRKTVGIRVPDNLIALTLLQTLNAPIISSTLKLPGEEYPLIDPNDIYYQLKNRVDLIIDSGTGGLESTTVIDFVEGKPTVIRKGKGIV